MADIRINALATTAASTASDDFIAVDGSANGTRKLNAYSPTFGGNLTVSGTAAISGYVTSVEGFVTTATSANTTQSRLYLDSPAGQTGAVARILKGGSDLFSLSAAGTATLAGNLTVSGGTITGGASGMSLASGGTNQNITLTPSGTGRVNFANGQITLTNGNSQLLSTGNIYFDAGGGGNLLLRTGNVLVGTTVDSGAKLQVGTDTTTSAGGMIFGTDVRLFRSGTGVIRISSTANYSTEITNSGGTGAASIVFSNTGGSLLIGSDSSAGTALGGGTAYAGVITTATNVPLIFRTNSTTALTLDSSQTATFANQVKLGTGKILYFDGGINTYLQGSSGSLFIGTNGVAALTLDSSQRALFASSIGLKVFTVATLPAATIVGQVAYVTDATQAQGTGGGSTVAGGGVNYRPVFSDGANWKQF
jgi:hypothetical protein